MMAAKARNFWNYKLLDNWIFIYLLVSVKMPEKILFDAKLGYKDAEQKTWTTISRGEGIHRTLSCGKSHEPTANHTTEVSLQICV